MQNKSIDKDPGCWLEFTQDYVITSSKTGEHSIMCGKFVGR